MNNIVSQSQSSTLNSIIAFWFGPARQENPFDMQSIEMQRWYGKSPEIDQDIKQRYQDLYSRLFTDETKTRFASRSIEEQLAIIITLDQFPRNMYRKSAKMYQADDKALSLCTILVQNVEFERLDLFKQMFGTLPMMHAESRAMQRETVAHFTRFVDQAKSIASPNVEFFLRTLSALQNSTRTSLTALTAIRIAMKF